MAYRLWLLPALLIYLYLPNWGDAASAPFVDPTMPFYSAQTKVNLETDLFSEDTSQPVLALGRWQVGLLKIFPARSGQNWAMIQGRRVVVGSSILGGRVVAIGKKQLELRRGQERRSLLLRGCTTSRVFPNASKDLYIEQPCSGIYFVLATR